MWYFLNYKSLNILIMLRNRKSTYSYSMDCGRGECLGNDQGCKSVLFYIYFKEFFRMNKFIHQLDLKQEKFILLCDSHSKNHLDIIGLLSLDTWRPWRWKIFHLKRFVIMRVQIWWWIFLVMMVISCRKMTNEIGSSPVLYVQSSLIFLIKRLLINKWKKYSADERESDEWMV
jgi:hypothetical protein